MSRANLGDGSMTVREAGRRGAAVVRERYGVEHYARIAARATPPPPEVRRRTARLGAAAQARALGPAGMHAKAVKGGEALRDQRGRAHFAAIARSRQR